MPPEPGVLVARRTAEFSAADLRVCGDLLRAGSKSFSAASWLLPARIRPQVVAFYAFCRVADDAVDDGDDPTAAVAELRRRVDAAYAQTPDDDPVDRGLAWVVHTSAIPRALIDAILEGFAWDAKECRYERLDQTLDYAARVASVVGVVLTLMMGVREPSTLARACDLGAAMQLSNIARDVGEDARRGRLYLPAQWLREEGIDPEAFLRDPTAEPGVRRATARLLAEADRLYDRAEAGVLGLPPDCRSAIRAAAAIYRDIGRVVARNDYDSVRTRARTSLWRKLWRLLQTWTSPVRDDDRQRRQPPLPEVAFLIDAVGPRSLAAAR